MMSGENRCFLVPAVSQQFPLARSTYHIYTEVVKGKSKQIIFFFPFWVLDNFQLDSYHTCKLTQCKRTLWTTWKQILFIQHNARNEVKKNNYKYSSFVLPTHLATICIYIDSLFILYPAFIQSNLHHSLVYPHNNHLK